MPDIVQHLCSESFSTVSLPSRLGGCEAPKNGGKRASRTVS